MVILSLFDGMSCGQIALGRAQTLVKKDSLGPSSYKYYASEIDKYAIKVTQANYPDTIQLGNIENWREWDIEKPDIIIGGSPCQGFSFAGAGLNFDDERSKLFFVFVDILKHYKPKYFLLENVIMAKEHNDVISEILGDLYPECVDQMELFRTGRIEPIKINSALVSAQNRNRLYWTNIPGIEQPKDKGILLKDIIEDSGAGILNDHGKWRDKNDKSNFIDANYHKGIDNHGQRAMAITGGRIIGRNPDKPKARVAGLPTEQMLEIKDDGKANCISTVGKDSILCYTKNYIQYDSSGKGHNSQKMRIFFKDNKSNCILAHSFIPKLKEGETETEIQWRKLTPIECERLQTVPDNYTNHVSNTQRYKMLGNGWTVDVIVHILKNVM